MVDALWPGQTPPMAGWKSRTGDDVYQLPAELFDALQIKGKSGKVLTAATSRPRGGLIGREYWDMMDYAHQVAGNLSPELKKKYGIVDGTNPFAGKNPWGYPARDGGGGGGTQAGNLLESEPLPTEQSRPLAGLLDEETLGTTSSLLG